MRYTHLYTDDEGNSRFRDVDLDIRADGEGLGFSEWIPVKSLAFAVGARGRTRAQAPEPRRNWILCLTGTSEVTASGETRTFGPGDVLLADNIDGSGHTSSTTDGWTVAVVEF